MFVDRTGMTFYHKEQDAFLSLESIRWEKFSTEHHLSEHCSMQGKTHYIFSLFLFREIMERGSESKVGIIMRFPYKH